MSNAMSRESACGALLLTVFEWVTDRLGAQGTVCGGGRYDGLFAQIGGKSAPAIGFAMGVERLIALVRDAGGPVATEAQDVYLVHQGEAADRFAFTVAERLRDHGFSVAHHCGGGSFKAQMRRADASGAQVAVIVGDDEAAAREASVKPLRVERAQIRELARPAQVRFTDALPKTRSGKIMRRLLRDVASGKETVQDTTTLEDLSVLAKLRAQEEA